MNIDRFKELNPPSHQFNVDDGEYVKTLNELPAQKPKRHILATAGTIAAAVAIVTVVALWALIGRGIRNDDISLAYIADGANPASATEITVTDEQKAIFEQKSKDCAYVWLPLFDKDQPPSFIETLHFLFNSSLKDDLNENAYLGKNVNSQARRLFDTEYNLVESHNYIPYAVTAYKNIYSKKQVILKKIICYDMNDGTKNFVVTYTVDGKAYIMSYIAADFSKDPLRFISNVGTEPLQKDYADEKIYYAIEKEILSDSNIKTLAFSIADVEQESDSLYCCYVSINELEYFDTSIAKPVLYSSFCGITEIDILYLDYAYGKFSVSKNQDREMPIIVEDTWENTLMKDDYSSYFDYYGTNILSKYGIVSMPTFSEQSKVYTKDTTPEAEDIEYKIDKVIAHRTRYKQVFIEITFTVDGKAYTAGVVRQPNADNIIEWDCILFKKPVE